ncbi:MAG: primosomal protein N' [Deltaproteobacteria bacterium RIFCSPLOWO2_02_FULL_46_8]|nr:MAG: primosomal protein N' [Deltaproteobacteria bacterium RIFCSPLOWO2_02_FULL_46_8]
MTHTYAQVAVATPLNQLFTYRIPSALQNQIKPGARVVVPFRRKQVLGFCIALSNQPPSDFSADKLKEILEVKDETPIFSEKMLELLQWLSDYYLAPLGEICRAALPTRLTQAKTPSQTKPRLKEEEHSIFHQAEPLQLMEGQKEALQKLANAFQNPSQPILLHGITGSGKTEVYLQFLNKVLEAGKEAILLVPEIGLTPQLIGRVQSRLQSNVAIYHSGLSDTWRQIYWEKMREGSVKVAVGTRSALFAPFKNLGAIIIDEEHDPSYKQTEGGFYYNARDAAILRAKLEKAVVVLGSATPSLETFYNTKRGKYEYISLPERATGATLPEVQLIDLKQEKLAPNSKTLSPTLKAAISENLYRGEQSLLFLNRRGFANFLLCQDCGHILKCKNCAISLTYHKYPPSLVCHYCDYHTRLPEKCPECQSSALKLLGEGTEMLEEELKNLFPTARIVRLDRDTAGKREHRHEVLHQMKKGEVDILLGTQIVAKGHDFPNVTLVGVILADQSLSLPDFRSSERTFQLLTQVAGRAGRGDKPGKVLIQTFQPEHFALQCTRQHDFKRFAEEELQQREGLCYPPFSRLAQIRLQGSDGEKVKKGALSLKNFLARKKWEKDPPVIMGPVESPLAKVRGKHRWQILIKAFKVKELLWLLRQAQTQSKEMLPAGVQIQIDVDCLNLM